MTPPAPGGTRHQQAPPRAAAPAQDNAVPPAAAAGQAVPNLNQIPPAFFPFMAQQMAGQQQNAAQGGGQGQSPSSVPPTGMPTPPPFMFPPGGMGGPGGFPFMLPFPPAPTFGGLSDEEVGRMEGRERENVEARIECLRNIQTLLDAAAIQLQQYTSILGALA